MKALVLCANDYRDDRRIEGQVYLCLKTFCTEIDWVAPVEIPQNRIDSADLVLSIGVREYQQSVLDYFKEQNKPGIVIDLGYMDRAFSPQGINYYWQAGLFNLGWVPNFYCNPNRLYERIDTLGYYKPRKVSKYKLPVLLATQKPNDWSHRMNEQQIKGWVQLQVDKIRQVTDRRIILKKHPKHKGEIKALGTESHEMSTNYWIHHSHCTVTYNSTVGAEALLCGRQVYCDKSAYYHEISGGDDYSELEDIKMSPLEDRRKFFERLAYAQWTGREIATGTPLLDLIDVYRGYPPERWTRYNNNPLGDLPLKELEEINTSLKAQYKRKEIKKILLEKGINTIPIGSQEDVDLLIKRVEWHKQHKQAKYLEEI